MMLCFEVLEDFELWAIKELWRVGAVVDLELWSYGLWKDLEL